MSACKNTSVGGEKIEIFLARHCLSSLFFLASDLSCLDTNLPYLYFVFPFLLFVSVQQLERENNIGAPLVYFH